jgi:hypothetical protein
MSRPRLFDQAARDKMVSAYINGATLATIANHFGLSTSGVRKILLEQNITKASRKPRTFDFESL